MIFCLVFFLHFDPYRDSDLNAKCLVECQNSMICRKSIVSTNEHKLNE